MMTATFSTFSLHLDLLPSTQPVQPRIRSVHITLTKMSQLPIRTLHHFVPASLPTFSSESRTGPQFSRSQEEISFLWGHRELRLQSPTSWTSDDDSALALHDSIFDPRRAAIKPFILKCNGFSSASPVNDGSPPTLSHSSSLLCYSPLCSANPSKRREEAPAKVTQHHLFLGSPSSAQLFLCHGLFLFPTPSLHPLHHLPFFLLLPFLCPTYAVMYVGPLQGLA